MKKSILLVVLVVFALSLCAQQPVVEWAKTYGGKYWDSGQSVLVTSDNKYIVAGGTSSQDNDTLERPTKMDGLIMKLNSDGQIIWKKTYGGNGHDALSKIIQTKDGGFIAIGNTSSTNGLFITTKGDHDVWILKLDSTGGFEWQKTYGGNDIDVPRGIIQDEKGEFIFTVSSSSTIGDFNNNSLGDVWFVKITSKGEIIWKKRFGGSKDEVLQDLIQYDKSSYIAVGFSLSLDGDMLNNKGDFIIKIDSSGNTQWIKSFGSSSSDNPLFNGYNSVTVTKEGDIIAVGFTWSFGFPAFHHRQDYLITKMDKNGKFIWSKILGGSGHDQCSGIKQLLTGEFIVVGTTLSNEGDVATTPSIFQRDYKDIWVLKLDSEGKIIWQTILGGSENDYPISIALTKDNSILITGDTRSKDAIFLGNYGGVDLFFLKLRDAIKTSEKEREKDFNIKCYPNPVTNYLTLENNTEDLINVKIANMMGQVFSIKNYTIGVHMHDCSNLISGIYQIFISDSKNKILSKKVIIKNGF
jgi:Secretion system C-terminal sorting domain